MIGFFVIGSQIALLPDYDVKMVRQYGYLDNLIDKWRPKLFFDGKLYCDYPEGNEESGYGIYTNGSGSYCGPDITILPNARIEINGKNTCTGIHFYCQGTLELLGGTIIAPTGITFRGEEIKVPEDSTLMVHATGERVAYSKDVEVGLAGTDVLLGNAVFIESFRAGYGSIQSIYPSNSTHNKASILGGRYISDNNLAIASYTHLKNGSTTEFYSRIEHFVGSGVSIQENPSDEDRDALSYNRNTGIGAKVDIMI